MGRTGFDFDVLRVDDQEDSKFTNQEEQQVWPSRTSLFFRNVQLAPTMYQGLNKAIYLCRSFNIPKKPMSQIFLLSHCLGRETGSEGLGNLPYYTEVVSCDTGNHTQVCPMPKFCSSLLCTVMLLDQGWQMTFNTYPTLIYQQQLPGALG